MGRKRKFSAPLIDKQVKRNVFTAKKCLNDGLYISPYFIFYYHSCLYFVFYLHISFLTFYFKYIINFYKYNFYYIFCYNQVKHNLSCFNDSVSLHCYGITQSQKIWEVLYSQIIKAVTMEILCYNRTKFQNENVTEWIKMAY